MVRTIHANKDILSYCERFDTSSGLTVGLIIGQTYGSKDYVVHLARTSIAAPLKELSELDSLWIVDHAKQATRMLSGGMHVTGVFVVSENDLFSSTFPTELKTVLHQMYKSVSAEYLFGNSETFEKIAINYCKKSKSLKSKSVDVINSSITPAEVKLNGNGGKWIKFECRYELDETYYLEEESREVDLKEKMNIILKDINNNLKNSVILFDGELKDEDETLDTIGKKKQNLRSGKITYTDSEHDKPINVTILQSCANKLEDIDVKTTNNEIKIVGQIFSKVWLNPVISFKIATSAIVQDIIRSLSTRLEMHWDSLIEEEHKEDSNSIHEPPRRVMITLPSSEITVSDYLFPGEGAEEVKTSVEEILDIKLEGLPDEIQDVEGSIDIAEYSNKITQIVEGKIMKEDKEHNRMLFIIGSLFALVVLIISIIVHLFLK